MPTMSYMPTLPVAGAALLALAAAGALARRACREGMACAHIVAAAASRLTGALVVVLGLGHVAGVVAAREAGAPYDFRLYALVLLGVMLLAKGGMVAAAARGIARGEPEARRKSLAGSAVLLLVSAPLVPLQPVALVVAGAAAANLATLLATRLHFARRRIVTGFELESPTLRRVA